MSNSYVITTQDLTKYYGPIRGIDAVTLQVRHGEVFGFLGPNGAGKTTTIRILLDMMRPTSVLVYLGITVVCVAAALVVFQRRKAVV